MICNQQVAGSSPIASSKITQKQRKPSDYLDGFSFLNEFELNVFLQE